MKKLFILLVIIGLCVLAVQASAAAKNTKETLAYKIAVLHTRAVNPEQLFSNTPIEPSDATIAEFQWILAELAQRCSNTKEEIASTIVSAWELIKNRGYEHTLLDTARALSSYARNTTLFGDEKVDFRKTSGAWTSTHMPEYN